MASNRWGRIVNIASNSYPFATIDDFEPDVFRRVLKVNLEDTYLGIRTIATNLAGLSHYMASKMGVSGLTSSLANDLADRGITVNAVAPRVKFSLSIGANPDHL